MFRFIVFFLIGVIVVGFKPYNSDSVDWKTIQLISDYHSTDVLAHPQVSEEEKSMFSSLGDIADPQHHQVVLKENGQFFALNNCDLNAWKWENNAWKKLSNASISGYNCTPFLFHRQGELMLLSGSGYWQNQLDLFRYDPSGKVVFIPTVSQPEYYRGNLNYQTDEGVYSLFGANFNLRDSIHSKDFEGYFLDLSTLTWSEVKVDWSSQVKEDYRIAEVNPTTDFIGSAETDSYAIIELVSHDAKRWFWLIIDKRTNELYYKEMPFLVLSQSKWFQVTGDAINHLGINSLKSTRISVDEMVKSAVLTGKISIVKPNWFKNWIAKFYPLLLGIVALILIFGGWWVGFKSQKPNELDSELSQSGFLVSIPNPEIGLWLQRLSLYMGQTIDQDQMESALGLSNILNADLRKVKRSRAIKLINKWIMDQKSAPLIVRVRDEQDNRIIKYEIHEVISINSEIPVSRNA